MLKLSDLALRPDIQLGAMLVSPSRRLVEGPGGHTFVEPLIMQVFLLLLDAGGRVVTRTELFDQCWGGVIVGDDSLNRAIAKTRRIGAQVAPGLYEIETIPRTGYRLTGEILGCLNGGPIEPSPRREVSRRGLIGGGAAAVAVAAGAGLWWSNRPDPRFVALMAKGEEAFRDGSALGGAAIRAEEGARMVKLYEEAVRIEPDSARGWGLLGYFRSTLVEDAPLAESARAVDKAQQAIHRALELDPAEPNARMGLFTLEGRMEDFLTRDRQLRDILKTDPNNLPAMVELMPLLQATGMTRESWDWNERILQHAPFAKTFLVFRAMKLWILGKVRDADNVIDRVRGLWPDFTFASWVRFMLFVMTNRPQAAGAMLDQRAVKLAGGPEYEPMWRASLQALQTRAPGDIARAREMCLNTAKRSPPFVNDMVMLLCVLGEKEAAFETTEGFLLWRGKIVSSGQSDAKAMDDYSRRMTQWLFTPPCALLRADPRFLKLCDEFGLSAYWRARGVKPDYQADA